MQRKWLRVVLGELMMNSLSRRSTQYQEQVDQSCQSSGRFESKVQVVPHRVSPSSSLLIRTPIQNSIEELYSLFRFVRAKPLDDWNTFRDRIAKPVKSGQTKIAMKRLQVVLKAIMLRRAKDATLDGKPILVLPGRKVEVVSCAFDADERAFYDALEQKSALTFNKVSHY